MKKLFQGLVNLYLLTICSTIIVACNNKIAAATISETMLDKENKVVSFIEDLSATTKFQIEIKQVINLDNTLSVLQNVDEAILNFINRQMIDKIDLISVWNLGKDFIITSFEDENNHPISENYFYNVHNMAPFFFNFDFDLIKKQKCKFFLQVNKTQATDKNVVNFIQNKIQDFNAC